MSWNKSVLLSIVMVALICTGAEAFAESITGLWVNGGEDKVVKDELRFSNGQDVTNTVWDGTTIRLFAARNEVVNFNVVIESAYGEAKDVEVSVSALSSPEGGTIASREAQGDELFDYEDRNIELFFVRYLQIKGLSRLAYEPTYDERHVPSKLQLPYSMPNGRSKGKFKDRPNANKFYPDIAVPIEAVGAFSIPKGENQSVWVDIYVPKDAEPGVYAGKLTVTEWGGRPSVVPIELEVLPLSLPDKYNAKTMVWFEESQLNERFTGVLYRDSGAATPEVREVMDTAWYRLFQMAKRHRISLITDGIEMFLGEKFTRIGKALDGSLFTDEYGYYGPGYGEPVDVYSIGTYGGWGGVRRGWDINVREDMWKNSDMFVEFFEKEYPGVEYYLYLKDEPHGEKAFAQIEQWARWVDENPGPGKRLQTLCTTPLPRKQQHMPSVDIAFESWGQRDVWEKALKKLRAEQGKVMSYNGWRPASGTFMIEDDGVALRVNGWIQFKHNIDRWYFWSATGYRNRSHGQYRTNVFREARTFGRSEERIDPKFGESGKGYGNGDGVLFYPGTDKIHPEDSYDLTGPIASLRVKLWRRGLQDYEYLRLAHEADPSAVDELVRKMIPESLWELGVSNKNDPSYIHKGISWSIDPDDWEQARRQLADIALGKGN